MKTFLELVASSPWPLASGFRIVLFTPQKVVPTVPGLRTPERGRNRVMYRVVHQVVHRVFQGVGLT